MYKKRLLFFNFSKHIFLHLVDFILKSYIENSQASPITHWSKLDLTTYSDLQLFPHYHSFVHSWDKASYFHQKLSLMTADR